MNLEPPKLYRDITIWQRKGNGKFLESSIICFSLGNQICHLHCEGTGVITYNEDIARYMLTTKMLTLNLTGNMTERESFREKNTRITTVFHSKYLPSIVRMFYWLEFNVNGAVTGIFKILTTHARSFWVNFTEKK